nr:LuxR C-terminal-related transcriptional regulator [Microbacterium lacticum]
MDLEVLRQLATGATDARSANLMGISVRTYRRHVAAILDTLGVRNRFQAAIAAREMHLI